MRALCCVALSFLGVSGLLLLAAKCVFCVFVVCLSVEIHTYIFYMLMLVLVLLLLAAKRVVLRWGLSTRLFFFGGGFGVCGCVYICVYVCIDRPRGGGCGLVASI